ncbi:hypothetical protein HJC23_003873 [Cyclotella cryptica]|uniref:Uncharacterized protein n=1 Tax=Cyclotella cryptica TaxID=29204 RepID=A0ABD3PNZ2_9STRA
MRPISSFCHLCFVFLVIAALHAAAASSTRIPAFIKRSRAKYTPLLFFKPMQSIFLLVKNNDLQPCNEKADKMEKIIRTLEKESNIHVQRLDIMRDRHAKKLYEKLIEGNLRSPFPLLYHRESLQRVYGLADVDLVRSWSKGRLLPEVDEKEVTVLPGEESEGMEEEMDLEELEMEMDRELTPVQRRGKEAMKRRMEEGRRKK